MEEHRGFGKAKGIFEAFWSGYILKSLNNFISFHLCTPLCPLCRWGSENNNKEFKI
jgi:hypothetical protein